MVTLFFAMNSKIILADMEDESILSDIKNQILQFEQKVSRFIPGNELDKINLMSPNIPIVIDKTLADLIQQSLYLARKTHYYVNPFQGEAMKRIGYTYSFTEDYTPIFENGAVLDLEEEEPIQQLNPQIIIKKKPFSFDFGGFGKGYIVDQCKKILLEKGQTTGLINAGGDLTVIGTQNVGIEHPRLIGKDMIRMLITDGSLATSGKNYRKWAVSGTHYHHILNGLTGEPAVNGVLQASVVADKAIVAETVAKLFCILPFEQAKNLVKKEFPQVSYFLYFDNDQLVIGGDSSYYDKLEVVQ